MPTTDSYFGQIAGVVNARREEIEADLDAAERILAGVTANRAKAEQEYLDAERRVQSYRNLLMIADGTMPDAGESVASDWMKLHIAMEKVLKDAPGRQLTAHEIAVQIEKQRLYRMRDGRSVEPQQIHARVGHYPNLFVRAGNGVIALKASRAT